MAPQARRPEWTGLGPGLLLRLDRDLDEPLRTQLEGAVRDAIRSGRLQAGERLPSTRELARELGVSRGLVQECYEQLHAEGYLSSRAGSGTRIATIDARPVTPAAVAPEPAQPTVEFRNGVPDLASFPRNDWAWAMREALRTAPTAALGYGDPRGDLGLRGVLAGYLRRVRAAAADPEHMVICSGFAQGLGLARDALAAAGVRRIAFEDPGYADHVASTAMTSAGFETVAVPVDYAGIDVDALAASGAGAVLLTPAHQWPTGVVLSPQRRRALVAWAQERDAYVVEDDYDAEFRYDREPVGVVQGLAPQRVIMIGTTSKALAPALRLGWMLTPPALTRAVAEQKLLADRGSAALDQIALAALIESGRYDRHLRRMRPVYAARREVLLAALLEHAPSVGVTGLAAGFQAVVHLPAHVDERATVAAAAARSVAITGMSTYRADGVGTPPQLVLGFGTLGERAIREGIAAIGDLLEGTAAP